MSSCLYDLMWWDLQLNTMDLSLLKPKIKDLWPELALDGLHEFSNLTQTVRQILLRIRDGDDGAAELCRAAEKNSKTEYFIKLMEMVNLFSQKECFKLYWACTSKILAAIKNCSEQIE